MHVISVEERDGEADRDQHGDRGPRTPDSGPQGGRDAGLGEAEFEGPRGENHVAPPRASAAAANVQGSLRQGLQKTGQEVHESLRCAVHPAISNYLINNFAIILINNLTIKQQCFDQ